MSGRTRRHGGGTVITLLVVLAGCQMSVGTAPPGASGHVEAYLAAAQDPDGDRGWSLLAGGDRGRIFGSLHEYLALADASSWEAFTWRLVDEHCDDNVCAVWIAVPSADVIPEVLARGPILYKEDHVPEGANAVVHVNLRDPFNRGIAMPYG